MLLIHSDRIANVNAPDVPPPDSPFPATPVMSPTWPLIVNVPTESSYDNETPVLLLEVYLPDNDFFYQFVPNAFAVKSPELDDFCRTTVRPFDLKSLPLKYLPSIP